MYVVSSVYVTLNGAQDNRSLPQETYNVKSGTKRREGVGKQYTVIHHAQLNLSTCMVQWTNTWLAPVPLLQAGLRNCILSWDKLQYIFFCSVHNGQMTFVPATAKNI